MKSRVTTTTFLVGCLQIAGCLHAPHPESSANMQLTGSDFRSALILDATGVPNQAYAAFESTIIEAASTGSRPWTATASAMSIVAMRARVDNLRTKLETLIQRLETLPHKLPPEALHQLKTLQSSYASKRGDDKRSKKIYEQMGCLLNWQTVGPLGPRVWKQFDQFMTKTGNSPPEDSLGRGPWPVAIDIGQGDGKWSPVAAQVDGCAVSVQNGRLAHPGITWFRSILDLDEQTTLSLRLESSFSSAVFSRGFFVAGRDSRDGTDSVVQWFTITLPAGRSDITIAIANDTTTAVGFSLVADSSSPTPLTSRRPTDTDVILADRDVRLLAPLDIMPLSETTSSAENVLDLALARLTVALWWEDVNTAYEIIAELQEDESAPHPIVDLAYADVLTMDLNFPGELAFEQARRLRARALSAEPRCWQAQIYKSQDLADDGRVTEAAQLLARGLEFTPEEPSLSKNLLNLAIEKKWFDQVDVHLKHLRELIPNNCSLHQSELKTAVAFNHSNAALVAAKALADCNRYTDEPVRQLLKLGNPYAAFSQPDKRVDGSMVPPNRASPVIDALEAQSRFDRALEIRQATAPLSFGQASQSLELVDALLQSNQPDQAKAMIQTLLDQPWMPKAELLPMGSALGVEPAILSMRIDGLDIIDQYESSGEKYPTSAVYVLDRAVYWVQRTGQVWSLVHTITQLASDEAVERNGEFTPPADSYVLTARTIKRDGHILEPEAFEYKSSLSLPNLVPGDYVEIEYIQWVSPSTVHPNGFDTGRFYFADFETAFHRSELHVITPSDWEVDIDTRGSPPPPTLTPLGDLICRSWIERSALPWPDEPLAPSASEYLPSTRVTRHYHWETLFEAMADSLLGVRGTSTFFDDILDRFRDQSDADNNSLELKKALYSWIMENIEHSPELLDDPDHALIRKAGNRGNVYCELLTRAGHPCELAVVSLAGADDTVTSVAADNVYDSMAVWLADDSWVNFDFEWAPFGYLPPTMRNRPAYLLKSSRKTQTTAGLYPRDGQSLEGVLTIRQDGSAHAHVREELTGNLAVGWRTDLAGIPQEQRAKQIEESYLSEHIPGAQVLSIQIINQDQPPLPLILEYDIEFPTFLVSQGSQKVARLFGTTSLLETTGGLTERRTDLVAHSTIDKKVSIQVHYPKHLQPVSQKFPAGWQKTKWGKTKKWVKELDNQITLGYIAHLETTRVPPSEYEAFRKFAERTDRLSELSLRFTDAPQSK